MHCGDNGILNKVQIAQEKSEEAQVKENDAFTEYENKISEYLNGTRTENENKYTKEEQIIGKWIDGRAIYRRVITNSITVPHQVNTVLADLSDSQINEVLDIKVVVHLTHDKINRDYILPGNWGAVFYDYETKTIMLYQEAGYTVTTKNVIFTYTKQ